MSNNRRRIGIQSAASRARRLRVIAGKLSSKLTFELLETRCVLSASSGVLFGLFVDETLSAVGLSGSYLNGSLRSVDEEDWRVSHAIAGTRVDPQLFFPTSSLGNRAAVGVGGGTDDDWDHFSVQWDGILNVLEEGIRLSTRSEGGSRMWIDHNRDGNFNASQELVNNNWGQGTRRAGEHSARLALGPHRIRIQYEDDAGPNTFSVIADKIPALADGHINLFTNATLSEPGIVGSYFDRNLRNVDQLDWRASQSVAGTRIDERLDFEDPSWGSRQEVGLTRGSDADWTDFSVQWDGVVQVLEPSTRLATRSDDSSRLWIDIDGDGLFDPVTELINNHWGSPQPTTTGDASPPLDPGVYALRIQYEEEFFGNVMQLVTVPPPQVRVAYVVPSDRAPQVGGVHTLEEFLPQMQQWYAEQMDRFGLGTKTFRYESREDGFTPEVHLVHVGVTDDFLREDIWGHTLDAAAAAGVPVWSDGEIWLLVPEAHIQDPDGSIRGGVALGAGGGSGRGAGVAMIGSDSLFRLTSDQLRNDQAYAGEIQPELGPLPLVQDVSFPWFEGETFSSIASSIQGALIHELSHAFGLGHDFRNDENFHGNLMGNGLRGFRGAIYPELYPRDDTRLSYAAALALSVSPYFTDVTGSDSELPSVSIATSGAIDPVDGLLEIEFTATDDRQLAVALLRRDGDTIGELVLTGQSTTTSFATPFYEPGQNGTFEVSVYDTSGNRRNASVQITANPGGNQAPQPLVKAFHSQGIVGQPVTLDATASNDSDHDNASLLVEWDLDGDGDFDTAPTNTKTLPTIFVEAGVRTISARLTDPFGAQTVSAPIALRIRSDMDFGDAPTAAQSGFANDYPVTLAQDGARHTRGTLFLGSLVDGEADGQPDNKAGDQNAGGDDNRDARDEDGVSATASIVATSFAVAKSSFSVTSSGVGKLDAWIDFDRDGVWATSEQIFPSVDVTAGINVLSFELPAGATPGETFARFRLSSAGGLDPRGAAQDGEVEDYLVTILDGIAGGGANLEIHQPVSGVLDIVTNDGEVVVKTGTVELFRGPGTALQRLDVFGLDGDDTFNLANLDSIFAGVVGGNAGGGNDTLRFTGSGQGLDLTNPAEEHIQGLETIDITGTGENFLTLDVDEVVNLSPTTNTLRVEHDDDDTAIYGPGWTVEIPQIIASQFVHVLKQEDAKVEILNARPFQNPLIQLDVNRDGSISPLDALVVVNRLNSSTTSSLFTPTSVAGLTKFFYVDTNGDRSVAPVDVILIVNFLNDPAKSQEGESAVPHVDPTVVGSVGGLSAATTAGRDNKSPTSHRSAELMVGPVAAKERLQQGVSQRVKRLTSDGEHDELVAAVDAFFGDFEFDNLQHRCGI